MPVDVCCEREGQGGEVGLVDEVREKGVAAPGVFAEVGGRLKVECMFRLRNGLVS